MRPTIQVARLTRTIINPVAKAGPGTTDSAEAQEQPVTADYASTAPWVG